MVEHEILWHRGIDASINRVPTVVRVGRPDAIVDMIVSLVGADRFENLEAISQDGRGRNFTIYDKMQYHDARSYVVVSRDVWDLGVKYSDAKHRG